MMIIMKDYGETKERFKDLLTLKTYSDLLYEAEKNVVYVWHAGCLLHAVFSSVL